MSGGHAAVAVYRPRGTVLHRLPAECKIVAVFGYVVTVVLTPITAGWAFAAHALVVIALGVLGRVAPGPAARRMLIELPFLAFAVALPFVAAGERTELFGVVTVSRDGLLQAFGLVARATLGVALVVVLAATTPARELLTGLDRLRMPAVIVAVMSFMLRYSTLIVDQMHRMAIARAARGHRPRTLASARTLAMALGSLFIRSYERGERVHLAMLSRGYTGSLPVGLPREPASRAHWAAATAAVAVGAAIAAAAGVARGLG
ncbi:cobalt ECF transporter T component CbiQ [Frankia nepalensis]|uniref:cobalt ECF transporter T component CbiQ n=1 Tax=Frankia nepalensis TaxID=1836974 RepID=UPI001D909023|nr:cobalt ECF transporter T component CbiQ [Frankia nepalensis]MBL7499607.1 cobalt ECF transporter T component CbiQ [Frankia nepalensis]MBL7515726.1 cobalt ECF transporter T component CbiQ [Frankia nepalensis]